MKRHGDGAPLLSQKSEEMIVFVPPQSLLFSVKPHVLAANTDSAGDEIY